jgi:hypothetical protein
VSAKTFRFAVSAEIHLEVDDIWPDGDAPENPAVADVLAVIAKDGGKKHVLSEWDLVRDLDLEVSDDKDARRVP